MASSVAAATSAKKRWAPIEKLLPYRQPILEAATIFRSSSSFPYQPVVPMTMLSPSRAQVRAFSITAHREGKLGAGA